jgi:hypothetical protein
MSHVCDKLCVKGYYTYYAYGKKSKFGGLVNVLKIVWHFDSS